MSTSPLIRGDGTRERYDALRMIAPTVGRPDGVGPYQTSRQQQQQQLDLVGQALGRTRRPARWPMRSTSSSPRPPRPTRSSPPPRSPWPRTRRRGFGAYVQGDGRSTSCPPTVVFPIFVAATEISGNPLFQALPSVPQGHSVVLEDTTLVDTFSSSSALGIQYPLENAVPLFAGAL
ncbi:MAG: putative iron-siderophore transporter, substrate-binding protein [Modestobacter sp.]|nr:putative iron-siderophore transporter, substrate-binding protein [Modestobacter sp.]